MGPTVSPLGNNIATTFWNFQNILVEISIMWGAHKYFEGPQTFQIFVGPGLQIFRNICRGGPQIFRNICRGAHKNLGAHKYFMTPACATYTHTDILPT